MRSLLRRSPGTSVWLFTSLVTTAVVRSTTSALSSELLRQVSTNLFQMGRSGLRVLFLSAFLFGQGGFLFLVAWFLAVSLPVERCIGTARWLTVVVAGHVGSTLVTTVGIWADVRHNRGATALVQTIDVGPSYGLYAVTAFAVVGLADRRVRAIAMLVLACALASPFFGTPTFTDTGHVSAAVLGAAWWLLVPTGAATGPLTNPWSWSAWTRPERRGATRTAP